MSKPHYNWKRFWCPRSGHISLADGGYLYDPDAEWGNVHNPDLVSLEAMMGIPCLVLLGEPGIGKSQELENLKTLTEKLADDTHQVLYLDLRSCSNLKDDLFQDETFVDWIDSDYHLHLFLDSLDEGQLNVPNIAIGLIDNLKQKKYQDHFNRLYIRLACRTFVFPEILEEGLKDLWKENCVKLYELAPLRRIDVVEAARVEGFSSDDFIQEIHRKEVIPLAIKPISLGFLLNTYRKHGSQFPSHQRLHELYHEGCKLLCEEVSKSRQASKQVGHLDSDQRLVVAARIAAITIIANRFAVWTGIDQGNIPTEDVHWQELCFGHEHINAKPVEINREVIEEVLDTGLFSSRGLNRIGWAHQTYAEFLAAWYLAHHDVPLLEIKQFLFLAEELDQKLVPQLHETAAWLASMRSDVLELIIQTDPNVLLKSDVPADSKVRASIVSNLLTQYEEGKLFGRAGNSYRSYEKLKHPDLVNQLRPYICDSGKKVEARDLAIDIAEVCEVSDLQDELANLALNPSESIYLRVGAAKTISAIGGEDTRLKLKPLILDHLPEDEDDQLKGYALKALWPDLLTAAELFQALIPPKESNFLGSYQIFLRYEIVSQLQPTDLVVALNWLKDQGLRCFGHPFEDLGDAILFKAWENFDLPGVAKSFAKVALVQWREYQPIITRDGKLQEEFYSSLVNDTRKRHSLIKQSVLIVVCTGEEPNFILSSLGENILISEDIFWMLEQLQASGLEKTQKIWVQLIERNFDRQDARQIDTIITTTQFNSVLQKAFESYFTPIELNSDQAKKLKDSYLSNQEIKARRKKLPLLDPLPKDRVIQALEKLESGNLDFWWQLNMEMTLEPDSKFYNDEFELDLTILPGWKEADEPTQKRIIEGAKTYVHQYNSLDYGWIGTDTFDRPSQAGCRAFQLLLKDSIGFVDTLSSETWKRWTPAIVGVPHGNQYHFEIVKLAYLKNPQEAINTLLFIIERKNQGNNHISALSLFKECWDDLLKSSLLKKIQDNSLRSKCFEQLLEELLKHELAEARGLATSMISFPLPESKEEREKVLVASRILVENSDPSSWAHIWSIIQQDLSFGRELIELLASRYSHGIQLNLTEPQLADLYLWLVHQYPDSEDLNHRYEVLIRLKSSALSQLKERGTHQACVEIQRLIQELPELTWLGRSLIEAKKNMRRQAWQPLSPKDILQLIAIQEPSHTDLHNQLESIDRRTQRMADEPKSININTNISDSTINAPVVNSGDVNNQVYSPNIAPQETSSKPVKEPEERKDRINWLAIIGIGVTLIAIPLSMSVSGAFNTEFRQWFNHLFSPQIEQKSEP